MKCIKLVILGVLIVLLSGCKAVDKITIQKNESGLYDIKDGNIVYSNFEILNSADSLSGKISAKIYTKYDEDEYYGSQMLAVIHNNKTLLQKLDKLEFYPAEVYTNDIDGDGEDEVIVMSKFYGQRIVGLRIFKVADNKINELYSYPKFPFDSNIDDPYENSNFGFTSQLMDDYKVKMKYSDKNFETAVDITEDEIKEEYYNEDGKLKENVADIIKYDCFSDFDIEDVDKDGMFEIIGYQNAGFEYKQSVGIAKIILKYSSQNKTMEVIDVDFEKFD